MNTWDDDDVERFLNDWPLPAGFIWHGEKAWPRYQLKKGYGQWLRTAGSYHPALRGLFRTICNKLQAWPVGQELPTPDELAAELKAGEELTGSLGLELDPTPPPTAIGRGVDFAALLRKNRAPQPPEMPPAA